MLRCPRAFAALLCFLLPFCSCFAEEHQEVTIQAVDPATRILVDGAEDYRVIDQTWSLAGKLDAIGSIGLLFPVARQLEPRTIRDAPVAPTDSTDTIPRS